MWSCLQRCCRPQERLPIAGVASVHFWRDCGWNIAVPLTLYGLGLGFASAQLRGTLLSEIPVNSSGQASATQSTVRQVGSALGTAVSGSVFSTALGLTLPKTLEAAGIMGPGPMAQQKQRANQPVPLLQDCALKLGIVPLASRPALRCRRLATA